MFTDVSTGFLSPTLRRGRASFPLFPDKANDPQGRSAPQSLANCPRMRYEKAVKENRKLRQSPHADRSFLLPVSGPFRQRLSRSGDHTGSFQEPTGTTT